MDLFEITRKELLSASAPLANRIRPRTPDEVVGQEHILGEGKPLSKAISADKLGSVIFYGPPGTGKTTLAYVIANTTDSRFVTINATTAGKKDMEEAVSKARDALGMEGRKTILFIDEIHRFNKAQQDYLLPYVEDGTIALIGATTENPYFEVNRALLSRSRIFELKPLSPENIAIILRKALKDKSLAHVRVDEDAIAFLSDYANGDARAALNVLELASFTAPSIGGETHITRETVCECVQKHVTGYGTDEHYDTVSAFIKSMRGSDPDAAVYYLARMLCGGEDVKFIARRIMICAAEDVGNADPQALVLAVAAAQAVERVGMPEGRIILSQAVTYVACAPKSNASYIAISKAMEYAENQPSIAIPPYLRDAHYSGAEKLGRGVSYAYPHDYPNHWIRQRYLPEELEGLTFYTPSDMGYEKGMKLWLERIKKQYERIS